MKKEIFELFQKRKEIEDESKGSYFIPEDYVNEEGKIDRKRKEDALYAKYDENKFKDGSSWEESQIKRAKNAIGGFTKLKPQDQIEKRKTEEKQYDYVFDNSQAIQFQLDSTKDEKQLNREQQILEEKVKEEEKRIKTIEQTRKSLPVYKKRTELMQMIKENQVMIIVGETGSGKTTQIPQYLYEDGYTQNGRYKIGCTQPRRVAATSVATRVSDEVGTKVGDTVGYTIRFDDKSSEKTEIKYMTDGMLLREFLTDFELSAYSVMMIDEAHERTLSTDVLLGLLKVIIKTRSDFKLLICSATMNAAKFSEFFEDAPIYNIPGRTYEVELYYTPQPEANYIHAAITTVFQIHLSQGPGDILVFLTGQEEIENMAENLAETSNKLGNKIKELLICPIYANLPSELQQRIFEPTPKNARKVVLATNIAETSLTIDGIVYVIDSGFVKENKFNPSTGMESLEIQPCSKASANQRAGRAGRVGPGKCFRLFTKTAFETEMPDNPTPEILRVNLNGVVLLLFSLGITDIWNFDYMDAPSSDNLAKSLSLLYSLGAFNENGGFTKIGRQMSEFPVDPMLSKCLLTSGEMNCCSEVLSIISMLQETSSLFYRSKEKQQQIQASREKFISKVGGDHLTYLNIWNEFVDSGYSRQWCHDNFVQFKTLNRVKNIRTQLERICVKQSLILENAQASNISRDKTILHVMKSIVSGYFWNVARLNRGGDSYKSLKKNQQVWIHPSSAMFKLKPPVKFLIYNELVLTSKEFMRNCMPISERWLSEYASHYYTDDELNEGGKKK
ncbi:unnamed protein product [Ambrosiozyma monospora]|uniref:Unnamed protein product n=1 Tax=Ambrosiozyma monospora TaxID=43982 RepID=A0ACB5SRK7_AMBMO|nr:unnamed protein product [Ambrosiozyma monospora]